MASVHQLDTTFGTSFWRPVPPRTSLALNGQQSPAPQRRTGQSSMSPRTAENLFATSGMSWNQTSAKQLFVSLWPSRASTIVSRKNKRLDWAQEMVAKMQDGMPKIKESKDADERREIPKTKLNFY